MTTVVFLQQPDPDWLTLLRSEVFLSTDGYLRLELDLQNLSKQQHPGVEVSLEATKTVSCEQPAGGVAEIDLAFSIAHGVLTLSSGDPQFKEPIERRVTFSVDPCGTTGFSAILGPTGVISAGQIFRIRYRFPPSVPVLDVRNKGLNVSGGLKAGSRLELLSLLRNAGQRRITLVGDNVYPRSKDLEIN